MRSHLSKVLLFVSGAFVLTLIGMVIVTGLKQNQGEKKDNAKIQVVSSLNSYGEMAESVLGNQGDVQSVITSPDVDPHDFEPTANTAKQYRNATVIISNGGGYDEWSERFAKSNSHAKSVNLADMYDYHDGDNEHYWYQPDVVARLTNQLVDTYSEIKPDQREYFEKNAKAYQQKAEKLTKLQAELKADVNGKGILATEPVFDPQLEALGAKMLVPEFSHAIEEGNDPTPAALTKWQTALQNHQAVAVINNTQTTSKLVKQALEEAQATDVPIVPVTESMPKDKSYIDWQYDQLKSLQKAVQS